ncbi:type I-E CRISPR-associated endoribonuclease Cas2 [Streptomyces sp. NPDC087897]|uniref:type I-E CRISPR-associated endoribonuclease Cas2 n=1 Tax=Streptomyces sp. NPDC087897 TaxID=3365817 RepID=UPI0037FE97A4
MVEKHGPGLMLVMAPTGDGTTDAALFVSKSRRNIVGGVSAKVRDELWAAVTACTQDGLAALAHPADNEQGFQLRTAGTRRREPIDFDGLTSIAFHRESQEMANPL